MNEFGRPFKFYIIQWGVENRSKLVTIHRCSIATQGSRYVSYRDSSIAIRIYREGTVSLRP